MFVDHYRITMREVPKEEFFAFMRSKNVHPKIVNRWEETGMKRGYIHEWRLPTGELLGVSESMADPKCDPNYFLK